MSDVGRLTENLGVRSANPANQIISHIWREGNRVEGLVGQIRSFKEIHGNLFKLPDLSAVTSPEIVTLKQQANEPSQQRCFALGQAAYTRGEVALLILAGGQGTRLGYPGPKGCFYIQDLNKYIFEIHLENVKATECQHDCQLPVIILTSDHTDTETRSFLIENKFFGLDSNQFTFVKQGNLPNLKSGTGEFLLASDQQLLVSPNGHGGFLAALSSSGTLATLQKSGIKYIDMIQIDNILAQVNDPAALGTCVASDLDILTRVFEKSSPLERVGNYVRIGDRHLILEYTDVTTEHTQLRSGDNFVLRYGSTGSHIWSVNFLIEHANFQLPYHVSRNKSASWWDPETNQRVEGLVDKLECFNFDLIPVSARTLAWEINRSANFAAIKGSTGLDSLETAVALYRQARFN